MISYRQEPLHTHTKISWCWVCCPYWEMMWALSMFHTEILVKTLFNVCGDTNLLDFIEYSVEPQQCIP